MTRLFFNNSRLHRKPGFATIFLLLTFLCLRSLLSASPALAAACSSDPTYDCQSGCTDIGACGTNGKICIITTPLVVRPVGADCGVGNAGSQIIGPIVPPQGVGAYNARAGVGGIGILIFASNALKFFAVICGVVIFFNFISAGFEYITGAGKTETHTKVREKLTWSVLGLVLLISAYVIAAIIGLLIFGNASFILQPNIVQYGALAP